MDSENKDTGNRYSSIVEQLRMDIKSSMSLAMESDTYMAELRKSLFETPDPAVRSFLDMVSRVRVRKPRTLIAIALGEIAFSALMIFLGLVLIIPTFFAYSNPGVLLGYFSSFISSVPPTSAEATAIILGDFVISVAMLLSAFQIIRMASAELKEAGLTVNDAN